MRTVLTRSKAFSTLATGYFLIACSNTQFTSSDSKKSNKPQAPNDEASSVDEVQRLGQNSRDATESKTQDTAKASDCLTEAQRKKFSCDDLQERRGGLNDEVIGVNVFLLPKPLPYFTGLSECERRGAEIIASDNYYSAPISECIGAVGQLWSSREPSKTFATFDIDAVRKRLGTKKADLCLGNKSNADNVENVGDGKPANASMEFHILCVRRLNKSS